MRERPILFSAPMVRAILAGTKTQTRRAVKPQPTHPHFGGRLPFMLVPDDEGENLYLHSRCLGAAIRCPYGQPGDRLWVRETFCDARQAQAGRVLYRATDDTACRWTPSIHMPRASSRITLELTSVRVERLQDISAADATVEGIGFDVRFGGHCLPDGSHFHASDPRISYWSLWDAINGPGSVEANPWAWVLEFRRL